MSALVLQTNLGDVFVSQIAEFIEYLPQLVGAGIVLAVGKVVGESINHVTRTIVARTGLDEAAVDSPFGQAFDSPHEVGSAVGSILKYYVYLLALLVAANILGLGTLRQWAAGAVGYVPSLLGGLAVLVLGLFVADYATDVVRNSETRAGTPLVAAVVRAVLYFLVVAIALDTAGIEMVIVQAAVGATLQALVFAVVLAVGLALGLGGSGYVADHLPDWMDRGESGEEPETR